MSLFSPASVAMGEACDLKVRVNGRHTLLLHQSVVCAFSGRLREMAAKERKGKKKTKRVETSGGGAEALMCIELDGFPGGGEGFELAARFCYGDGRRLPPLRPVDLPLLHCAAAFLEMTEEVRAGNLLAQAEAFVDDALCYWTWADLLAAVKACEAALFDADVPRSRGLFERLVSALFSKVDVGADTPKSNRSSSSTCSSSSPDTAGGRPSSAAKTTPESTTKPPCLGGGKEWWFDDAASLSPATVDKAVRVIGCHGADNKNPTVTRFLLHYLRRRKSDDPGSLLLAGLADTAVHGVARAGAFSCRGLFWALRTVSAAGLSKECRRKLERLVGMTLDQATLDDLLVSGDGGGVYDVSLVMRLVRVFVTSSLSDEDSGSPSSSSSQRMVKVGRLVDKYLAEISPDQGLRVSRFLAVAESLPDSARDCYDGVYRALDIYLESHAALTVEERATLCRCLNYEKLTLDACKELAKNRRIPPGIAVQAMSTQRPPNAAQSPMSSLTPRRVAAVDEEKEALRQNLRRMQGRVAELETACKEMRSHVKVPSRTTGGYKAFGGGRGLPWMC